MPLCLSFPFFTTSASAAADYLDTLSLLLLAPLLLNICIPLCSQSFSSPLPVDAAASHFDFAQSSQ